MFRCYSYTIIIREHINLCLLKLQLLKQSIKIHRCVVNTLVVWLHTRILGLYWCMCVALFGCRLYCDMETSRSYFNVNFNTVF